MYSLYDNDLKKVSGGISNPVSGLSYEEAMKKAKELGPDQKDMGGWKQMSQKDFMNWWRSSNKESKEYLDHKKEVDDFIGILQNNI